MYLSTNGYPVCTRSRATEAWKINPDLGIFSSRSCIFVTSSLASRPSRGCPPVLLLSHAGSHYCRGIPSRTCHGLTPSWRKISSGLYLGVRPQGK